MPGKVHLKASDPKVQADLNRYYEKCREKDGNSKEYCARVAWNILCANKSPDYEGCTEFGKDWGPPYSAPRGEGVEHCSCRRKFGALMATISEDKNLEPDGAVRRAEFDTYPTGEAPVMTAEVRMAAEKYVLDSTPSFLKFQNVRNQDVITYGDQRGHAVVVPVAEMTDDELVWLATQRGWTMPPIAGMVPLASPLPGDIQPSTSEALRHMVNVVMEGKLEGFEGIGTQYIVKGRRKWERDSLFRIERDDFYKRINVTYDGRYEDSREWRKKNPEAGHPDWAGNMPDGRPGSNRMVYIGHITYEPAERRALPGKKFYGPLDTTNPYRIEVDFEVTLPGDEERRGSFPTTYSVEHKWRAPTAEKALNSMCVRALEWMAEPRTEERQQPGAEDVVEWGSVAPKTQTDIREKGRVSMDPSVALKWLKLMNQAQQKDDRKAMLGIARAAAKKYGLDEPTMPFEVRKFAIMLSHLAGTKPPPWTSESYIPGVQEDSQP